MPTDDDTDGEHSRSLGPSPPAVDIPEVDVPSAPEVDWEPDDSTGDAAVQRLFWRLVVVFDVGFLALALGPMFIYFESDWSTGGPLVALGALSLVYGVSEYRAYRADD